MSMLNVTTLFMKVEGKENNGENGVTFGRGKGNSIITPLSL